MKRDEKIQQNGLIQYLVGFPFVIDTFASKEQGKHKNAKEQHFIDL